MSSTSVVETFFDERRAMTPGALNAEMQTYRMGADPTENRLNAYAFERFGIERVTEILENWWGGSNAPTICLARQVIACSTEQLAFSVIGRKLLESFGWDWRIMPFVSDCYGRHKYKESLIKIPELQFDAQGKFAGTKGVQVIASKERRQQIFGGPSPLLRTIPTDAGTFWGKEYEAMYLPEFHAALWQRVKGGPPTSSPDAGTLHNALLKACMDAPTGEKPAYFFREIGGHAVKCDASEWSSLSEADRSKTRPPAQWYYFFYLSLFLTGRRALFASLDDDKDVHAMFQVMTDIERVTGRMPQIAAIPYKHSIEDRTLYFNEVNPTLFSSGGASGDVWQRRPRGEQIFDLMLDAELALSKPWF